MDESAVLILDRYENAGVQTAILILPASTYIVLHNSCSCWIRFRILSADPDPGGEKNSDPVPATMTLVHFSTGKYIIKCGTFPRLDTMLLNLAINYLNVYIEIYRPGRRSRIRLRLC